MQILIEVLTINWDKDKEGQFSFVKISKNKNNIFVKQLTKSLKFRSGKEILKNGKEGQNLDNKIDKKRLKIRLKKSIKKVEIYIEKR